MAFKPRSNTVGTARRRCSPRCPAWCRGRPALEPGLGDQRSPGIGDTHVHPSVTEPVTEPITFVAAAFWIVSLELSWALRHTTR